MYRSGCGGFLVIFGYVVIASGESTRKSSQRDSVTDRSIILERYIIEGCHLCIGNDDSVFSTVPHKHVNYIDRCRVIGGVVAYRDHMGSVVNCDVSVTIDRLQNLGVHGLDRGELVGLNLAGLRAVNGIAAPCLNIFSADICSLNITIFRAISEALKSGVKGGIGISRKRCSEGARQIAPAPAGLPTET